MIPSGSSRLQQGSRKRAAWQQVEGGGAMVEMIEDTGTFSSVSPLPVAGNGFFSLRKLDNFPGLIFNYCVNTVKGKRKFQTRQQLSGKTREREEQSWPVVFCN